LLKQQILQTIPVIKYVKDPPLKVTFVRFKMLGCAAKKMLSMGSDQSDRISEQIIGEDRSKVM